MDVGGGGGGETEGVSLLADSEVVSWLCVGGWRCLTTNREGSGIMACGGWGRCFTIGRGKWYGLGGWWVCGERCLTTNEGGRGGLEVSHYWQTVKWYYGCVWGWGCLTVGREGSGIMAVCGAGGISLLAESEVVLWLCVCVGGGGGGGGWRCCTIGRQ